MLSVQLSASYKHTEMEEVEIRGKNNFLNSESKQKILLQLGHKFSVMHSFRPVNCMVDDNKLNAI